MAYKIKSKKVKEQEYGLLETEKLKYEKKKGIGNQIEVNDIGWVAKIVPKSRNQVSLVVEEDGSVRWYSNPDYNSDKIIKRVFVEKVKNR